MTMQIQENLVSDETTKYYPDPIKEQLRELFNFRMLAFLFIPGKKMTELDRKKNYLNINKSQRSIFKKLLKSPLTIVGLILILMITTWAIFPHWIAPYEFSDAVGIFTGSFEPRDDPLNPLHPLGTTKFGRDVYSRLIWGARISLTVSITSVTMSVIFGIIFGMLAAYYGGAVNSIIMRITDIFLAFPGMILTLVMINIFERELKFVILIFGLLGIPGYTRLMRGAAMQEINKPYVYSSVVSGAPNLRVIFTHILPNCIAPILVNFTFNLGGTILGLAGIGFLGISEDNIIEWGSDIAEARGELYRAPWAALWPGFGILATVLGFMLVGDGLRDALDPRINK